LLSAWPTHRAAQSGSGSGGVVVVGAGVGVVVVAAVAVVVMAGVVVLASVVVEVGVVVVEVVGCGVVPSQHVSSELHEADATQSCFETQNKVSSVLQSCAYPAPLEHRQYCLVQHPLDTSALSA